MSLNLTEVQFIFLTEFMALDKEDVSKSLLDYYQYS